MVKESVELNNQWFHLQINCKTDRGNLTPDELVKPIHNLSDASLSGNEFENFEFKQLQSLQPYWHISALFYVYVNVGRVLVKLTGSFSKRYAFVLQQQ